MIVKIFLIALKAGIPRDSHNFNGLRHILTDSILTPQILTDNGLGRGAMRPSNRRSLHISKDFTIEDKLDKNYGQNSNRFNLRILYRI